MIVSPGPSRRKRWRVDFARRDVTAFFFSFFFKDFSPSKEGALLQCFGSIGGGNKITVSPRYYTSKYYHVCCTNSPILELVPPSSHLSQSLSGVREVANRVEYAVALSWSLLPLLPPSPHFWSPSPLSGRLSPSPPPPVLPIASYSARWHRRRGGRPLCPPASPVGWSGAPSFPSPGGKHRKTSR